METDFIIMTNAEASALEVLDVRSYFYKDLLKRVSTYKLKHPREEGSVLYGTITERLDSRTLKVHRTKHLYTEHSIRCILASVLEMGAERFLGE